MTPAALLRRVRLDPETGCWIWRGPLDQGIPVVTAKRRKYMARRVAYELERGPIPKGHVVRCPCDDQLCICPWHTETFSRKQSIAASRKAKALRYDAVWRARVILAKQSGSKLHGRVAEIRLRLRTETQTAIARDLGVTPNAISKIATGRSWREAAGPLALMLKQAGML